MRPKRSRYSAYKPSGVEWLGPVPEGWSISKLGFHASVKARLGWKGLKADEYVDEGFIFLSTPNIKNRHIDFDNVNYITKERYLESPEIMLEVGDVLIAKDGSTLGTTNVVRNLPAPATVNSSIAVLRPESNLDSSFLYWIMTCPYTQSIIQQVKDGQGVPHLFQADLRKFRVWLPSYKEQRTIAAHLNRETTRIDTLIEKKQRQIELLQEKRTALISHAVTKGLDPNAKMKDSGVEWLGEIPVGWEIWKVTHAFGRIGSGTTPKSDNYEYYDGQIPWVTTSELRETSIDDTLNKVTEEALRDYPTLRLYPSGTLLFAMYGATIGRLGILKISAAVNQACAAFSEPIKLDPKFTYYWLYMRRPILIALSAGGGQPNLSQDDLKQLRIPTPPLNEQRAIAAYLDRETTHIDVLTEKVEKSITLLREYRTSLISAAVTGKIDIRKEAA